MTTKARNWLIAIFIMAFPCALFLGFLVVELNKPLAPIQPLPSPNGYDDFVKAGKMLVLPDGGDYDKLNQEQLRKIVSANAAALSLARSGFTNQCRVTLDYSATSSTHLKDLADLKRLARCFIAEGKLAEMENRPADAAKSYLDAFHLGNESACGGVLIDGLVGIAIQAIATSHLTNLVSKLDATSCDETAATLKTLESQSPTWEEIMQQEHDWSRRTFPGFRYEISRLMNRKSMATAQAATKQKFKTQQQRTDQLLNDLASHASN